MNSHTKVILFFAFIGLLVNYHELMAAPDKRISQANQYNSVGQNFFIKNKGQWSREVLFLTQINGMDAWILKDGVVYDFYKIEGRSKNKLKNRNRLGHRVFHQFLHTNSETKVKGGLRKKGVINYFNGVESEKENVSIHQEVLVKGIYEGIDIRYYFHDGLLRHDYIVHPGADPEKIRFRFKGSKEISVNNEGEILFNTNLGDVSLTDLYCFQGEQLNSVQGNFEQTRIGNWKIQIGEYDPSRKLIIDPLIYSSFIGGSGVDEAQSIVIDDNGNTYITGYTQSTDFDTSTGPYQSTFNGSSDAFVTKLGPDGTSLEYSTYIGGDDFDSGESIAVDNIGNVYITGETKSVDYPVTNGVYQSSIGGSNDVFVTKLDASGTNLLYSTYLGGTNLDRGYAIALDQNNNAYVTGSTNSNDYPTTSGAYQGSIGGNNDVFVTKLNTNGSDLAYSTYLGGSDNDTGLAIDIDNNENAYISGSAGSSDFDISSGAFQSTNEGGLYDVFVTKLSVTGGSLEYSTFIGGNNSESCVSIDLDNSGNVFLVGNTSSTNYDVTASAFQTNPGGNGDGFITKLNASGNDLIYSTYIGGSELDYCRSVKSTDNGIALVSGSTESSDFEITSNAYQTVLNGNSDAFVSKLYVDGTDVSYSTYIGGNSGESAYSIALDSFNNPTIAGITSSTDLDVSNGAYQTTLEGTFDGFITRLDICSSTSFNIEANSPLCIGETLNLSADNGDQFNWYGPNNFNSAQQNPSISNVSLSDSGSYVIEALDPNGCIIYDSVQVIVENCANLSANGSFNGIKLFPNPTAGSTQLETNKMLKNAAVAIYNTHGKLMYEKKINESKSITLNLSNLESGMYYILLKSDEISKSHTLIRE